MLEAEIAATRGAFRVEATLAAPTPGVIALFGRSGSGKTTLVDALAGLVPARGRIRLGEATWLDTARGIDVPTERRRIGYVFQDARLFPHLDVLANLRYGESRAPADARYVRFDEIVALLGLEGLLARRTAQLSGGERQRVALGRALLAQPRLLLLDEPLASLDAARRDEVMPYLERLRDRYAVPMVYVSHQYEEVLRLASHAVLVEDGRVAAAGPPARLAREPALRRIVGPDAVGAVIEAVVESVEPGTSLATVAAGAGRLQVEVAGVAPGTRVRVHVPARDVILATEPPRGLSVRTQLEGVVTAVHDDGPDARLVVVESAGAELLARVTEGACSELGLAGGRRVWALVKATSLRGHAFARPPADGEEVDDG